jgi:hypothetical protein
MTPEEILQLHDARLPAPAKAPGQALLEQYFPQPDTPAAVTPTPTPDAPTLAAPPPVLGHDIDGAPIVGYTDGGARIVDVPETPPPTPRWRIRIDTGDRAGADEYEFTGDWEAAQWELHEARLQSPAGTRVDLSPLAGPSTREAPLEDALSPVDLALSAYGGGAVMRGGAQQGARLLGNALGERWGRATGASLASEALYKGRQAVGLEPGHVDDGGLPDVLNLGVPFAAETLSTLSGAAVRHSRAGEAFTEANAKNRANQLDFDTAVTRRAAGIQEHQDARGEALRLTRDYAPPVPSSTLYDELDATYGTALQNIRPLHEAARRLKTQLGEHYAGPELGQVRRVIDDVLHHDELTPFATVHEDIKRLGRLTRSADPQAREMAGELFGAAHDSVSRSSDMFTANRPIYPALQKATATFRHEKALEDVDLMISANLPTGNDAVERLRAGNIRTRLDTKGRNNPHFRESFPPDQWDQIGARLDGLNELPTVGARPTLPPPVQPTLAAKDTGYRRLAEVLTAQASGALLGHHETGLGVGLGLAAADIGWDQAQRWLVKHPATLERLMEEGMRVPYRTLGTLSVLGR